MQRHLNFTLVALGLTALPTMAQAYIGPGLGAGVIATVLGVLAAVIMAFVAVLWYPLKRMFRRKQATPDAAQSEQ